MFLRFLVWAILFSSKKHELDFVSLCVMKKEAPVFSLSWVLRLLFSLVNFSYPYQFIWSWKRTESWFLVSILIPVSDVIGLPQLSTESLAQLSQKSGEKFKKIPADCSVCWAHRVLEWMTIKCISCWYMNYLCVWSAKQLDGLLLSNTLNATF